eukprot:1151527-Pelagomonas_calceolata.AAC.2
MARPEVHNKLTQIQRTRKAPFIADNRWDVQQEEFLGLRWVDTKCCHEDRQASRSLQGCKDTRLQYDLTFSQNTAARVHLNNHNPAWLQGLARDVPEAKWKLNSVSRHSTLNSMHADMPGFKKCERLLSDKQQILRGARTVHISNQNRGSA